MKSRLYIRVFEVLNSLGALCALADTVLLGSLARREFPRRVSPSINWSGRLCGAQDLWALKARVARCSSAWTNLVLRTGVVVCQEGQTVVCLG